MQTLASLYNHSLPANYPIVDNYSIYKYIYSYPIIAFYHLGLLYIYIYIYIISMYIYIYIYCM